LNGKYSLLFYLESQGYWSSPEIIGIKDENRNGTKEILVHYGLWYDLLEYNGNSIESLINPDLQGIWVTDARTGEVDYRNLDGDGMPEIIAYMGIPEWDYGIGKPWRKQWDTYTWNGEFYNLTDTKFGPPEYRFQAAIDGDRYTLNKEYQKALSAYQDVIFSDRLDWWSAERNSYEYAMDRWNHEDLKPVMPDFDPNEYKYLAAYARYRIVVLYLLQGWDSDARIVYDALQVKYPEGTPGSIYARLAKTFWEKYQSSGNMGDACQSVKYDVDKNSEEVFKYLGIDGYLGMSLPKYTPQDICPFE
jgi:hypothetical protein